MKRIELLMKMVSMREDGERGALATIIRTKGSTPRKTGSKMLVYPNGEIIGTIGGGCGEGEVIEEAFKVINSNLPTQYQVDLTEGLFYEDGGICGGTFDVFIEPI